mmetsp:Transcript_60703/g.169694  ORF Transcript_60703/g.169694 Transcript_60703/m.169694 type:complete len:203 (-) Transcript_60703:511-1119(-)
MPRLVAVQGHRLHRRHVRQRRPLPESLLMRQELVHVAHRRLACASLQRRPDVLRPSHRRPPRSARVEALQGRSGWSCLWARRDRRHARLHLRARHLHRLQASPHILLIGKERLLVVSPGRKPHLLPGLLKRTDVHVALHRSVYALLRRHADVSLLGQPRHRRATRAEVLRDDASRQDDRHRSHGSPSSRRSRPGDPKRLKGS